MSSEKLNNENTNLDDLDILLNGSKNIETTSILNSCYSTNTTTEKKKIIKKSDILQQPITKSNIIKSNKDIIYITKLKKIALQYERVSEQSNSTLEYSSMMQSKILEVYEGTFNVKYTFYLQNFMYFYIDFLMFFVNIKVMSDLTLAQKTSKRRDLYDYIFVL